MDKLKLNIRANDMVKFSNVYDKNSINFSNLASNRCSWSIRCDKSNEYNSTELHRSRKNP